MVQLIFSQTPRGESSPLCHLSVCGRGFIYFLLFVGVCDELASLTCVCHLPYTLTCYTCVNSTGEGCLGEKGLFGLWDAAVPQLL